MQKEHLTKIDWIGFGALVLAGAAEFVFWLNVYFKSR